ncbi:uncharacterized protein LOC121239370 [Juglans microcarpa x Juglans regia]|uniref:uncharacterized protein LOC121239370 n=1 Tax=Juglans microcarpa x Juglans regia TaxID=2249226 RepID=UPI001B7EDBA4|nr:uncharacterized protein LOC121239370 [Juglans microcarpa x Juglans regia]XP_040992548.1 uncharacterized protein LOC121239370 [Juglans microcarpa x Juglans regia]
MSDEGEKTCPLCAEEMDLTDQQLKPCKCGYEICVWCWHHILDMAEKDETEGRCPACRSPYDKEKIVGMAANCERMVAEISMDKKKCQKVKSKPSEGRKQLSSVRVIQRNLVYIVGLPLNLADEDLLQNREYFGQYGKVLKVSMSRTAAGVIQQFPNSTCSVYITYSKEEEAIRCIQNVHGFILDGRSLRACFGTTKYCHAWLRNVPCSNSDCLYLHEIGPQEDSFSKDEIISAYTRSRVQQITGATNNLQRRSGNLLPPPADEYYINSSTSTGKPIVKTTSQNIASVVRSSPPNGSSGRSIALPAAASWGMRTTDGHLPAFSISSTNGPSKQKPDTVASTLAFPSAVTGLAQASTLNSDVGKRPTPNEDIQTMNQTSKESLNLLKQHRIMDSPTNPSKKLATPDGTRASLTLSSDFACPPASVDNDRGISLPPETTNSAYSEESCGSTTEKLGVESDRQIQNLCSDMSLISIDRIARDEHAVAVRPHDSLYDPILIKEPGNQGLQQDYAEQNREPLISTVGKATAMNGVYVSREQYDCKSDSRTRGIQDTSSEVEDDILSFESQRLKDPEVVSRSTYLTNLGNSFHVSRSHPLQHGEDYGALSLNADRPISVDNRVNDGSLLHSSSISVISNAFPENLVNNASGLDMTLEHSFLHPNDNKGKQMGSFLGGVTNNEGNAAGLDKGESSIISNILSMDCDTWGESLASPQNLANLFRESDKQSGSRIISGSWKAPNNNQSRFSFARHEESRSQPFDVQQSFDAFEQLPMSRSFSQYCGGRDLYLDKQGIGNGFSSRNFEESENLANIHPVFSPNKLSGVSRAQISAPPGFSMPSRAPPPGFSSSKRMDQAFDPMTGNHLLDTSSLLRNSYQTMPTGNIVNTGDIEFMDPAILAVGEGRLQGGLNNPGLDMRSTFPPQLSAFENDSRFQLLMQSSLSPQQNRRFADIDDNFSHRSNSYGLSTRLADQSQASNLSPFAAQMSLQQSRNALMSNGHWDSWNEVQGGNGLGMTELLRNDRLGYNKFYTGYEDSKYRMPSSGDLYNRTFGM